jgi:broad specificity phosphatase PhoE
MKLIFIRHAEPDYKNGTITEKGRREAQLLSERTAGWDVDAFFCSPFGRARDTAAPTLARLGRTAENADWLREFSVIVRDPSNGKLHGIWDFAPSVWLTQPLLTDADRWQDAPCLADGVILPYRNEEYWQFTEDEVCFSAGAVQQRNAQTCEGLDAVLARYGYIRSGKYYHAERENDATLVFFAHFGVICFLLGHLLNLSPISLLHGTWLPPSSVTVLGAEHALPGEAYFRTQTIGDVSHLLRAGEPVSRFGYFTDPFQK